MGLKLANYVLENATAPGTATINLGGAPTGRRTFAQAFTSGSSVFYFIDDGTQYECGVGTFTAGSPNRLARTTILETSAGGTTALNFTGACRVFCEQPASALMSKDDFLFASGTIGLRLVFPGISGTSSPAPGGGVPCLMWGALAVALGGQTYTFDRSYAVSAVGFLCLIGASPIVGTISALTTGGITVRSYTTTTGAAVAGSFYFLTCGY